MNLQQRSEPFKKELPVALTEQQILSYSKDLARITQDLADLEVRKKAAMAQFSDDIASVKAEISSLSRKVSTGEEMQPVSCQWFYEWHVGSKVLRRLDSMDVIRVEPITQEERQQNLSMTTTTKKEDALEMPETE